MKNILLTFLLLAAFVTAKADTLDYVSVYVDDSLVAQFIVGQEDGQLSFSLSDLEEGQKLSFRYFDDTPCDNCRCSILARDQRHRKLRDGVTKGSGNPILFSVGDLQELARKNESKEIEFWYMEYHYDTEYRRPMGLVLILKV